MSWHSLAFPPVPAVSAQNSPRLNWSDDKTKLSWLADHLICWSLLITWSAVKTFRWSDYLATKLSPSEVKWWHCWQDQIILVCWSLDQWWKPSDDLATKLFSPEPSVGPWWPIVDWGHFSTGRQLSSWAISVKVEPADDLASVTSNTDIIQRSPSESGCPRDSCWNSKFTGIDPNGALENFEQMSHSWAQPQFKYRLCFSIASDESESLWFWASFRHEGRTPWIISCWYLRG